MPRKKKVEYVTQAEFARKIGTSRQNISYALKRGTIKLSSNGLINFERQKRAYEENRNLSQVRERMPSKQVAKKPKKKKTTKTPKTSKYEEDIKPIKNVPGIRPVSSLNNIPLSTYDDEYSGEDENIGPKIGTYAYNQNRKIAIEADRIELKYASELGQVIPTNVALLIAGSKLMSIKDALLAMPSRTTGLIEADIKTKVETWKDGQEEILANTITNILKDAVNDVLSALAASVDSLPKDVEKSFESKK